jgi:hypothetical protein
LSSTVIRLATANTARTPIATETVVAEDTEVRGLAQKGLARIVEQRGVK